MRSLVLLVGVTAFLMLGGPLSVSRARADYVDTCGHGTGDDEISVCTSAIHSGRWHGSGLAWAYNSRGAAYYAKGDLDRAIADYDEAIRLDPKEAIAYNNRGVALPYHKATTTAPSPTTTRRSGSIPNTPSPTTTGASRTTPRATTIAPSPTTTRRSGSIPNSPSPTSTGASRTTPRATYDRAIADYNEAIRLESEDADSLQQPGHRVPRQGRHRPRHRRLQRGDQARSQRCLCLQQPGRHVLRQGRQRPRHRRLQRGDQARSQKYGCIFHSRGSESLCWRSYQGTGRPQSGKRAQSQIRLCGTVARYRPAAQQCS